MNKTDIVIKVSQKTGINSDICKKVIKAFEELSQVFRERQTLF